MVDSLTKSGKNGERFDSVRELMIDHTAPDKEARTVVPRWSHNPEDMLVNQPEYELTKVPLTSINLVTTRTIKVKHFVPSPVVCVDRFRWNWIQSWNAI